MNASTKTLDWQPVPGRARRSRDVYVKRGVDIWTVKRASMNHATFYVVRLNGGVVKRCELLKEAQQYVERMTVQRETVR